MGWSCKLRSIKGRDYDADAEHRPGIRTAAHPREQYRAGSHSNADQQTSLGDAASLPEPHDAHSVQADRRANRHRPLHRAETD